MADKTIVYVAGDQTAVPVLYRDIGGGQYAPAVPTNVGGPLRIGDDANAKNALGLTVNQGAADDEALSVKSTDVAHGITDIGETDTFLVLQKITPTGGGAHVRSFAGAGTTSFVVSAYQTAEDAVRSTLADAPIYLQAATKSGTSVVAVSANKNLVVFANNSSAQFIFDTDGDSFENGTGWTAYDAHDDVALLEALDTSLDATLRAEVGDWLGANKAALEAARIVHFNDDTDGVPFVNRSRLQMLLVGAVRQQARALAEQQGRIAALEARALPGA